MLALLVHELDLARWALASAVAAAAPLAAAHALARRDARR